MTRKGVAAAVLGLALIPGLAARAAAQPPASAGAYIRAIGQLRAGDAVPSFRAKDLYGVDVCLQDLLASGRKPVLAFWSIYCKACVEKFNALVTVQARYADRGIAVISVNTDGEYQKSEEEIRKFLADYGKQHAITINFPVLYDERNWLAQALRIEFLPTIISVGPSGRVAGFYQKFDEKGEAEIVAGIEGLVRELLALYPPGGPVPSTEIAPCPDEK